MKAKIFIDGSEGTTGLRIHERFQGREDIELLTIAPELRKDPQERKRLINASDFTFLCLPDAAAREAVSMIDLEGKLKLEYYKLQKTFEGSIELQETKGVYEPAKHKGAMGGDSKEPLDEIIEKINEKFKGAFTDGDKVLLNALHTKLMADKKLTKMARSSDPQIFAESIFPKAFGDAAQDSYMESQDTYTSLFEDQNKYNAIMSALADVIYREMRKN